MRRTLSTIALAVLTVGLLGSCSKINERLDNLEKKVDGLENEKIASIQTQVDNIGNSIADLGAIRSNIQSLTDGAKSQGQDIAALQAADKALDSRIEELSKYVGDTLKAYATEEWARATFSTLGQYEKTCDTIAKIDARIGALDENLTKKIADCADSLTTWINGQFEGYYTVAEMDAKLGAMQDGIDAAKAANLITDAKADSLAVELTKVQPAIDSAKAQLTREYTAAIDTAITTLDGKLTKQIQDEIEKVNGTVTDLSERVGKLEFQVKDLLDRVWALEQMIQTVKILPAYSDGSVKLDDDTLFIECLVTPAKAVWSLTKDNFTVYLREVATKAVNYKAIRITDRKWFSKDAFRGTVSIKVPVNDYLPENTEESSLVAALNVKCKHGKNLTSDITTEFVPVYDVPYVVMKMGTGENAYTLKWRKMNLGATTVAGSLETCAGDYYMWGATELAYSNYNRSTNAFTFKQNRPDSYGGFGWDPDQGFTDVNTPHHVETEDYAYFTRYTGPTPEGDGLLELLPEDDAATVNLGNGWRMPTKQEFQDLFEACGGVDEEETGTYEPAELSTASPGQGIYWLKDDQRYIPYYTGVPGLLFVDGDGNKLFFPATDFTYGSYWSSTLCYSEEVGHDSAIHLTFFPGYEGQLVLYPYSGAMRYDGNAIRPVSDK